MQKRWELLRPLVKDKFVLDLGFASELRVHDFFRKHAAYVVGWDINKKMITTLRKKGYDNISCVDVQDLTCHGECYRFCFDVVYAGNLIEHLDNFDNFLQNVWNNLKEDGFFVLETPNGYALQNFVAILLKGERIVNKDHVCWFDIQTLSQLLDRYGFRVVKWHGVSYNRPVWKFFGLLRKQWHQNIFVIAKKKNCGGKKND